MEPRRLSRERFMWKRWLRKMGRRFGQTAGAAFLLLALGIGLAAGLFRLVHTAQCVSAGRWERRMAVFMWETWYPCHEGVSSDSSESEEAALSRQLSRFLLRQLPFYRNQAGQEETKLPGEADPSYQRYLDGGSLLKEYESLVRELSGSTLLASAGGGSGGGISAAAGSGDSSGQSESGSGSLSGQSGTGIGSLSGQSGTGIGNLSGQSETGTGNLPGQSEKTGSAAANGEADGSADTAEPGTSEGGSVDSSVAGSALFGSQAKGIQYLSAQLADYDFLMKHFYTVHPTAAAGRELMRAEDFLARDFSLQTETEGPQILIYHSHSQEEYADYHQGNKEATVVNVGEYLAELLTAKGYQVIHDTGVYDLKDGKLDRSRAYAYSLDGITAILQKYPSIQVVLDIHRDGVSEDTRLVTEVNGKPTATIMFFNGTSETPDGPIEYLNNPYRTENLAFSFQMKLCADAMYPDFTRKIYLKGLRYNLHLRPCSALIEVGAQNNTYEEARNAMEPLAELLDRVLKPAE